MGDVFKFPEADKGEGIFPAPASSTLFGNQDMDVSFIPIANEIDIGDIPSEKVKVTAAAIKKNPGGVFPEGFKCILVTVPGLSKNRN
jgi:hypothetical protein